MKNQWEKVGMIAVDAGLCWIGDPCYILHKDKNASYDYNRPPKDIGLTWSGGDDSFCDRMDSKDARQFDFDLGHAGLGVCVSTGWGDGAYPVEIRRKDGRIAEVRVRFID